MSDNVDRFTVERILRRKLIGDQVWMILLEKFNRYLISISWSFFQVHYLIKWEGWNDRTWEPIENLDDCDDFLKDFELKQAQVILSEFFTL